MIVVIIWRAVWYAMEWRRRLGNNAKKGPPGDFKLEQEYALSVLNETLPEKISF
jgi:hypothetical protein